jgi:predicted dienelactone hydrolase
MYAGRLLLVYALCLLLPGCGEELPRPEVTPLSTPVVDLQALYKWGGGPYQVAVAPELRLPDPGRENGLSINVYYPADAEGALPVLLFSHGNFSSYNDYDKLISHWVSHGYVVLAPLHRDANRAYLGNTVDLLRHGNLGIIEARRADLLTVLDSLAEIETLVPQLAGRLDPHRVAATGHSFGAFNAQQLGGAAALDTDSGAYRVVADPRIKAVLAISPPGPMFDEIDEGSWRTQQAPTLMTTGTWDSNAWFWPDWRSHTTSYNTAAPGNQYLLVVQGADHYLGNLICRLDLDEQSQWDALAMINTMSIAFLDAYVLGDPAALAFLRSRAMNEITDGFATLEMR